eukprot:CAMPEP_0113531382 /NCGR_PEP_ID=MMETSP0015_2-20120614/3466_1 /TAXON_ID=2838 /ORGANISM="Odontella" /LENGTH=220 /DNA_ID=CAMNT_0000430213 /DNA_START=121 /DNA_END=783 /DNA_ORIENTATION=- /assembly_acc=CAM_ASM_000160
MAGSKPGDELWTSKLGNKYRKIDVEVNHNANMALLQKMRSESSNRLCAECGKDGTIWSSVNLGVFTCMRCGSLHRALGTHVSKPKGCTGTYLWGPDEISRMQEIGNKRAAVIYGGISQRPEKDAPDSVWLSYLRDKYERNIFAGVSRPNATVLSSKSTSKSFSSHPKQEKGGATKSIWAATREGGNARAVPTDDLLQLSDLARGSQKQFSDEDFFAQFGV